MSMIRTRWAAVGAAVAVTLGAGGLTFVDAAKSSGDRPVTVTIEPCRLRDTRPDRGIGGRTSPLGPAETYPIQATGPSGNCDIPTDATGLVLNVTADQATQATNLRLYPTGGTVPTTSNLNPRPGAPPTPNSVTVGLSSAGQFTIRNAKGTVHVIIDVTAYLVNHTHDDRYYTERQADAMATRLGFDRARIDAFVAGDVVEDMVTLELTNDTGRRTVTIVTATLHSWSAGYQISMWTLDVATNGGPKVEALARRSTVTDTGVLLMPSDTMVLTTRIVQDPGDTDVVSLSGERESGAIGATLEAEMVSITAPFDETGSVPVG